MTPNNLYALIEYIKVHHDPDIVMTIIRHYDEKEIDELTQQELELLALLMKHVFAKVLTGKTADQAFGLKLAKGEYPRPDTLDRDVTVTIFIILKKRRGRTHLEAIGDAANKFFTADRGDKAAEKAYAKYRNVFENPYIFTDKILDHILNPS